MSYVVKVTTNVYTRSKLKLELITGPDGLHILHELLTIQSTVTL